MMIAWLRLQFVGGQGSGHMAGAGSSHYSQTHAFHFRSALDMPGEPLPPAEFL